MSTDHKKNINPAQHLAASAFHLLNAHFDAGILYELVCTAVEQGKGDQAAAREYLLKGIRSMGAGFVDTTQPVTGAETMGAIIALVALLVIDNSSIHLCPKHHQPPNAN